MSETANVINVVSFRRDEPNKEILITHPNTANKHFGVASHDNNIELYTGYTKPDGFFTEDVMAIPLEVVPELIEALRELSGGV